MAKGSSNIGTGTGSGQNRLRMIKVTCIIRPHRVETVKTAIASLGISGMTVADVRGVGNSPEKSAWFAGEEHLVALPLKCQIEVVCHDDLRDDMIATILEHARTGEPGDGKIFVEPVRDAIRIRTVERGDLAI